MFLGFSQKDASRSNWSCFTTAAILTKSSLYSCELLVSPSFDWWYSHFRLGKYAQFFNCWFCSLKYLCFSDNHPNLMLLWSALWYDSLKHVHIPSLMSFENLMLAYQMGDLYHHFSTSNRKYVSELNSISMCFPFIQRCILHWIFQMGIIF